MKKIMLSFLMLLSLSSIAQEQRFRIQGRDSITLCKVRASRIGRMAPDFSLTISGRLKGLGNQTGRLIPWDTRQSQVTVQVADDQFSFKIKKQKQPVGFNLQFYPPEGEPNEGIRFFVHQSDLMITGAFEKLAEAKVSGDMTNEDYGLLKTMLNKDIGEEALSAELGKLDYQKDSAAFYDLIRTKGVAMAREKLLMRRKFIADHPGSFISMFELSEIPEMYTADSYAKAYAALSPVFKSTMEAAEISRRIEQLKITASGKQAVDFSRKDQFGKSIKLSDFKGKLVLLDFWGSWCKPCRETHPHLKELYQRYKDKGLEIVAVAQEKGGSLAENEKSWKAAIKKDGINWVHVMNAGGTDLDIVKVYGITAFPTKILLDKEGKILMRATSGFNEEIEEMIIRLLGK
ncbi:TlpA disulfide reductase family protein [Pedobacter sp. FW305-3-2-15-E-R2A2]|uniref:TlpA disulfide reductase family protein n=1 Tax=Pedobacter sp. FW305-3-2-15-E-R2A2 TaxID=3140251 RepID=UPI003140BFBF